MKKQNLIFSSFAAVTLLTGSYSLAMNRNSQLITIPSESIELLKPLNTHGETILKIIRTYRQQTTTIMNSKINSSGKLKEIKESCLDMYCNVLCSCLKIDGILTPSVEQLKESMLVKESMLDNDYTLNSYRLIQNHIKLCWHLQTNKIEAISGAVTEYKNKISAAKLSVTDSNNIGNLTRFSLLKMHNKVESQIKAIDQILKQKSYQPGEKTNG